MPTVIDLFCGTGGFSLGAKLAGFDILASIDKDPILTSSYLRNFPLASLLLEDISKVTRTDLMSALDVTELTIDGLIGGPPCQGFSLIGRRDACDPRNDLIGHFYRLVAELQPRFFVMENVPGILAGGSRRLLENQLEQLEGYTIVGPVSIDAHKLGAATRRRRVIVVGYRPSELKAINEEELVSLGSTAQASVEDAIADLPTPVNSDVTDYLEQKQLSGYAIWCRQPPPDGLGSEHCRSLLEVGKVTGNRSTQHTAAVLARFAQVKSGSVEAVSRFPRLRWEHPAPTLRAGTGNDRGSYQAARPLHPKEDRVITVREAARLQGFPDWFEFHETKWHSFRMIGNSVSPIAAECLLKFIRSRLN